MTIEDLIQEIDTIINEAFTKRELTYLAALKIRLELKIAELEDLLKLRKASASKKS
jgi:hypothetical protein